MAKRKELITGLESTSTEVSSEDNLNKDLTAVEGTEKVIVPTVEQLKEEIKIDAANLQSAAETLKIDTQELVLAEKGELTKDKVDEIIDKGIIIPLVLDDLNEENKEALAKKVFQSIFTEDDKDFEPNGAAHEFSARSVEVEVLLESLDIRGTQEQLGLVVDDESEAKLTGYFNLNIDNEKAHGFFSKGKRYLIEITEL